jgi:hypothetical protein
MFDTWINVLTNEIRTNKWMNVTWIFAFSYKFVCQMCSQCTILVHETYELWMNGFCTIFITRPLRIFFDLHPNSLLKCLKRNFLWISHGICPGYEYALGKILTNYSSQQSFGFKQILIHGLEDPIIWSSICFSSSFNWIHFPITFTSTSWKVIGWIIESKRLWILTNLNKKLYVFFCTLHIAKK